MKILGYLLVSFAFCVYIYIVYCYYYILSFLSISLFSLKGLVVTSISLFILLNLIYNHLMAIFASPGIINDDKLANFDVLYNNEQKKIKMKIILYNYVLNVKK